MEKSLIEEVEALVEQVRKVEGKYLELRTKRKSLELQKTKIETDLQRAISFDNTLKNEGQRTTAFNISKFKNVGWLKLVDEDLPGVEQECLALFFEQRRLHELIACRLHNNVTLEPPLPAL